MKKNRKERLEQAVKDFKSLVIYFCVTRPQHQVAYMPDGKFSAKELIRQLKYLENWPSKSKTEKRFEAKSYARYSEAFNLTFGIPSQLVKKVIGKYDRNTRIKLPEVLAECKDVIREINAGRKVRDKKVKCWWTKKYLLVNQNYWFKLLSEPAYAKLETFPRMSERTRKAIFDFMKQAKNDKAEKEEKEDMKKQVYKGMPHPADDIPEEEPKQAAAQAAPICVSFKSALFPKLQNAVDKLIISADEADRLGAAYGSPLKCKPAPCGWSIQDGLEHKQLRKSVFIAAMKDCEKGLMPFADEQFKTWLVRSYKALTAV